MQTMDQIESTYARLIEDLGRSLGIEGLAADEDRVCGITAADDLSVEIELLDDEHILISSIVARVSDSLSPDWVSQILDANVYWRGTGGGTLGFDSETGSVVLCFQESIHHLDSDTFAAIFKQFCEAGLTWSRQLQGDVIADTNEGDAINLMQQRV